MTIGLGLCGLVVLVAAGSARADSSPFVGHWHWNKAQSTVPPGEPVPADMTAEFFRVDPTHVRWRMTITSAQGQKSVASFDTPANGEFYPISGDTMAAFRLNDSTLQATFKGESGETDSLSCAVSADRQKMTCNGEMTGTNGKPEPYVDVYDRR